MKKNIGIYRKYRNSGSDKQTVTEKNWEILKYEEKNVKEEDARGFCRQYTNWKSV